MASNRVSAAEAAAGAGPLPAAAVLAGDVYPQPTSDPDYNNPDCENMPVPDWSVRIDAVLDLVTSDVPHRPHDTDRVWPIETVGADLLIGTFPDKDASALNAYSKPFGNYVKTAVLPRKGPKIMAPQGLNLAAVVSAAAAEEAPQQASFLDQPFNRSNANRLTHHWTTCAQTLSNLASRISYYLYRCEKYNAFLQLINCIEAREREQDNFRPVNPRNTVAMGEFMRHQSTIDILYKLLYRLKTELGRNPPSAIRVTFETRGSNQFNVFVDPGLVSKIEAYKLEKSKKAAEATAAAQGYKVVSRDSAAAEPWAVVAGPKNTKNNKRGKGRITRRKNGRRRTQKKRKTYV